MSDSLFYNRDRNITGVVGPPALSGLSLTPSYGSTVTFQSRHGQYTTDDFYYNLIPFSVNSLTAKYSVNYQLNETNATKLINFFEAQSGYKQFEFNADNSGIYQNISGFCDEYDVSFNNNQNIGVNAVITVDGAPTLLNWSGQNFTNLPFQGWNPSSSYKKYDVVFSGINTNNLDNFYYATEDHTSSAANCPTGASSSWSRDFFFTPDVQQSFQVGIKSDILNFKNSFVQRLYGNAQTRNIAKFDISYTFKDISDNQAKCMLHFLENKAGYRRFRHDIPSIYDRPKVYYCPTWTHTWKYANANDIQVQFVEDPLGVIPSGV